MGASVESEVMAEIERIAATDLELSRAIRPTDQLIADLELDSLGLTILAVGLEDRFQVKLTQEDSVQVTTVQDLALLVARRTTERNP
jgi:acyl carrier protein